MRSARGHGVAREFPAETLQMGLMMARPPQQPPDASGRGGRPGAQDPQAECIGPALPARRISPPRRLGWAIAAAALVLAPGVYFLAHSASAGPKGYVALPVRLLGMSQDTSIEGEQLVSRLKRTEAGQPWRADGGCRRGLRFISWHRHGGWRRKVRQLRARVGEPAEVRDGRVRLHERQAVPARTEGGRDGLRH
jgi:hypothetical protein